MTHPGGLDNRLAIVSLAVPTVTKKHIVKVAPHVPVSVSRRYEREVQEQGIPYSVDDIINLPIDDFNRLLDSHELTEEGDNKKKSQFCRNLRRRAHNLFGARRSRQRRKDKFSNLATEVACVRGKTAQVLEDRTALLLEKDEWTKKNLELREDILFAMGKDVNTYTLDVVPNREVSVILRIAPPTGHTH